MSHMELFSSESPISLILLIIFFSEKARVGNKQVKYYIYFCFIVVIHILRIILTYLIYIHLKNKKTTYLDFNLDNMKRFKEIT